MKNKINAYFTVEAAFILPMVMMGILLIIYLWFFQYDRCLMELDTNSAVLGALSENAADNNQRLLYIKNCLNKEYCEKYVAWNYENINIEIKNGKVYVERDGSVLFPFEALAFWEGSNIWNAGTSIEMDILSPEYIVRSISKIKGGN
ncbi:MAG: hypothetical protein LUG83_02495 [Lachnospiraceae bacterium]|nr:hypothetical protein [Lachnospiraceae bacterium]